MDQKSRSKDETRRIQEAHARAEGDAMRREEKRTEREARDDAARRQKIAELRAQGASLDKVVDPRRDRELKERLARIRKQEIERARSRDRK